jgi:hemerythrin-like domain-containing protein
MKITDAFLGEHGVFYAQFDHLEQVMAVPMELERVRGLARMLASALAPHAHMEDELLFDALGAEHRTGAIAAMYEEHEEIEGMIHEAINGADAAAAAELLLEAIRMAREHFLKEEQIAFPMAEELLSRSALEALGAEWAERRAVRIGQTSGAGASPG